MAQANSVIAIDKFDNFYVTDPQSDPGCSKAAPISEFDGNGHLITQRELFGVQGGTDLDPEHQGNTHMSERTGDQIQVYRPIINPSSDN